MTDDDFRALRELLSGVYVTPRQRQALGTALYELGEPRRQLLTIRSRCGEPCRSVETGELDTTCGLAKGHAGSHIGHSQHELSPREALLGPLGGGQ